jgi:translation initiation factor 2B subunit (eIF-2B alpha/beta/delta family)
MSVVRVLLRNRDEVLLYRPAADSSGPWTTVSGPADTDPERDARRAVLSETGLSPADITLTAVGESFAAEDSGQQQVHPFLFDCEHRRVALDGAAQTEWVPPVAILSRETVPGLWASYDRVRPTVAAVTDDREHGSTRVSVRALAVLRDEAGVAIRGETPLTAETGKPGETESDQQADHTEEGPALERVEAVARELVAARPSMTAVVNRVHRAMAVADGPADIPATAHEGIARARRVDGEAAATGADLLGTRVATLSRSGTVLRTVEAADPERVLVAESRPGTEGVDTATALANEDGRPAVRLTTDAAFAAELAASDVETLVVGADTVLADGRVVNKTGTRSAALAATHEGIDVVVVTASDKISPGTEFDPERRDPAEVYEGDRPVSVANPTFDVTPSGAVDRVVTERGPLDTESIETIATRHRELREWQHRSSP